ncbi:hypothetical protein LOTGIDRAFT_230389 [Lottia gigantea]|uniref:Timeless C-terminal domain-containing protein n=1 Tax=Lottia gigantea TaxID=225164 RepID=V4B5T0_LOTGI|nr:hypothetical protein LOTGIDRAFT_230389 [Lottia gigantea]ESP02891.1 hypothetical protein LOTGIDRAFT_230389 [Lottia gigantea]
MIIDFSVEEEEMECTERAEQSFDFKNYLNTYAKGSIMKSYGLLLAEYQTNTTHTNHCIIKMFYRVAIELGYIGMLFQASIFRTFQLLMYGPYIKLPRYKEMVKFGTYLISHFVKAAEGNPKIFMEILFWKSSPEAMDIIHGYGYTANNKSKSSWTEEQEQEVLRLFEESSQVTDPEKDVADRIMERLTDPTKTRNQLIRQLKRQGLIDSAADLKTKKRYDTTQWREEEELVLRTLYDRYKDSDDPIGNILNSDDINRSKSHVISKLIELDIIYDKSQVDKKHKASRKKASVQWEEEDEIKLRALFEEHRHAEEPLRDILLSLIGKSKNQVIDKLIDLELICHRAEIDKKYKNKKKKAQKDVWGNYDGEENLPDFSSSDEETRQRRLDCTSNLLERAQNSDEEEHNEQSDKSASDSISSDLDDASDDDSDHGGHDSDPSPKGPSSSSSPVNMKEMISDIVKCGYKDQMKWLQKSLQRTAANRQKNNSRLPIAVVPLTEENENAMEDEKFLTFMRHIGFSPPSNEQEAFWRIPGELSPDELTCIVQGLELDDNDEPSNADQIPTSLLQQNKQSHQNDKKKAKEEKKLKKKQEKERKEKEKKENAERKKKLKSKLEALKESRKRKRSVNNNDSDSSDDEVSKRKQKPARKGRKIQKMVDSDSDSNKIIKLTNGQEEKMSESENNNNLSIHRKKSRTLQSDSESEINNENKDKSDKDDNKDDDIEMSNTDYRLQLQSESEVEESQVSNENKQSTIKSDSDSDDQPLKKTSESFPATMLTQGTDSDSDVNDHIPLRKVLKKQIISSDED